VDFQTIELDRPKDGIVVVTLHRPDRMNAMTAEMFYELEALTSALIDDDALRVLILTGKGKAFCAGYDLDEADELATLTPMQMLDLQELAVRALLAVRTVRVPVIAAVNGAAAGGGLSLALAADIRLASESATFNAAFVRIGLSAGDLGASWLLPRLIGPARASEIAFTGRLVDAAEAERIGLVNRVVPEADLLDAAIDLAASICENSPAGVRLSKRALQANQEIPSYAAALELENRGQVLLTRGADMPEALAAFRQRRPANFTGR